MGRSRMGYAPLLFNLDADPEEMHNLAASSGPVERGKMEEFRGILRRICNPEEADAKVRAD